MIGTVVAFGGGRRGLWTDGIERHASTPIKPAMLAPNIGRDALVPGSLVSFRIEDGRIRDVRPLKGTL